MYPLRLARFRISLNARVTSNLALKNRIYKFDIFKFSIDDISIATEATELIFGYALDDRKAYPKTQGFIRKRVTTRDMKHTKNSKNPGTKNFNLKPRLQF